MEIHLILRDRPDGQVDIEEIRLPYSGDKIDSVTTATALADELRKCVAQLGDVASVSTDNP